MSSRWRHTMGFAYNPFSYLDIKQEAELALVDLTPIKTFLTHTEEPWAIQWLAPHGWGKTTQMRTMQATIYPGAPFFHMERENHFDEIPAHEPVVFLDGSQGLGWWQRRRLWRRHATQFIVSTHEDMAPALRRAGRTVLEMTPPPVSLTMLQEIVQRRLDHARVGEKSHAFGVSDHALEHLIHEVGGYLRGINKALYFAAQHLDEPRLIQVADLPILEVGEP